MSSWGGRKGLLRSGDELDKGIRHGYRFSRWLGGSGVDKVFRADNMSKGEAKGTSIFMEDQREMGSQSWVRATAIWLFFLSTPLAYGTLVPQPTHPACRGGSQSKPLDHQGIPLTSCLVGKLACLAWALARGLVPGWNFLQTAKERFLRVNVSFALTREESQTGLLLQWGQNWETKLSFRSELNARMGWRGKGKWRARGWVQACVMNRAGRLGLVCNNCKKQDCKPAIL